VLGVTITADNNLYFGCNHCHITGPMVGVHDELPHYDYGVEQRKIRVNGKFGWEHRNGEGSWENGSGGSINKLYRIDEAVEAGGTVLVCEGEKDVDNLWVLGFAAVCHPHGAGNWTTEHSAQLKGLSLVVLNDNDEVGYKYAAAAVKHSLGVARSVRRLDLKDYWPAISEGEDISDWLEKGGGSEDWLERIIAELPEINGEDARQQEPQPPPAWPWIWDKVDWDLYPPPEQEWSIPNIIPAMEVCLLSGHGATGKSTIGLWQAAAHVMAGDWMNTLPKPGGAFFIDAEDALDVIHRRLDPIRAHYGTTFETIFKNGLHILPMAGENAIMATVSRDGVVQPTAFYRHILERAGDYKPEQIVIASAANVFAGNENDRSQVQQFIGLLKRIAMVTGGSITLITHPSLTGLNTKSVLSGSTQWHNAVRARMVLESIESNGEEKQTDSDLRQLSFFKNQYGKRAASITLHWSNGMFLPVPAKTDYERAAEFQKADQVFTTLLRRFIAEGRQVSHKPTARNNAPKTFSEQEEATTAKCSKADLWAAMERLLKAGTIKVSECGPPSQRTQYLEFP
jgi:RecA-family ATPase